MSSRDKWIGRIEWAAFIVAFLFVTIILPRLG